MCVEALHGITSTSRGLQEEINCPTDLPSDSHHLSQSNIYPSVHETCYYSPVLIRV